MGAVGRADIIDDIITLLKAAAAPTYAKLAAMDDLAFEFGLRSWPDLFAVQRTAGVFVGPADGTLGALTVAAQSKDVQQDIQLIIYKTGYAPETDEREALGITEEIEVLLWNNKILVHGARIVGSSRFFWGPPMRGGETTIHWAVCTVHYELTVTL